MSDSLLDASEVAKRLAVPPSWPLEQARQGAIPCIRLGRYVRFSWPAIQEWLAELEQNGGGSWRKHKPKASGGKF